LKKKNLVVALLILVVAVGLVFFINHSLQDSNVGGTGADNTNTVAENNNVDENDSADNSTLGTAFNIKEEHQLADGSRLLYKSAVDDDYEHLITIASEKGEKVICDNPYCSSPVVSPDGTRFAYMDVLEWEELGEVYLYDLAKGQSELIIKQKKDIKDQYKPKVLCWLDNKRLLAIIGFAYGTVSVGGELYLYDMEQGELSLVLEPGEREEICGVTVSADEVAIEYARFDEEWNHATRETKTYKLQEFLSLITK